MANYPDWNPQAIVATSYCTPTWGNDVQDALRQLLQDMYDSKTPATNLRSFLRSTLTTSGSVKSNAMGHNVTKVVRKDQHHLKDHAESHTDGRDDIPLATEVQKGLMPASSAAKLAGVASNATRNLTKCSIYVGTSAASLVVSVGFRPQYIEINYNPSFLYGHKKYEVIDGATNALQHIGLAAAGAGNKHQWVVAASFAAITTYGFTAKASVNINDATFYFVTFKSH